MKELFYNASKALFYKASSAGIKVLLIILITNLFGAKEYGAYTFAMSVFLLLNSLFRFGFDVHLHKEVAELFIHSNKKDSQSFFINIASLPFFVLLFVSILIFLIIFICQKLNFLLDLKFIYLKELIIYSSFYSAMWLYAYYQRGLNRGNTSVIILEIIFPVLNILLLFFFQLWLKDPSQILMHSFGFSVLACLPIFFFSNGQAFKSLEKWRLFDSLRFATNEVPKSLPFLLISISSMLMTWADFYVISFFESESQLGIFSVATRIAFFMLFPASAVAIFFSNKLVTFYAKNEIKKAKKYLKYVTYGLFSISLILFLIFNLFNTEFLSLFGPEFSNASTILLILTFAQMINAGTGAFETPILMSDHKRMLFKLNFFIVGLNIVLNIPLVYWFGINGAGIGTLIAIVVNRILQLSVINRIFSSKIKVHKSKVSLTSSL